ncbi:hypothetical protein P1X15_31420 [Runella sp. MFBS21]|uniref:hypothetical protein n=1 Tax=Runella sp. MFBS21 TaxID=3034018 RepID=UPI0023FA3290|nr:hypothetical protein [Runella sp. MFBS21]MDF7822166.1 hypothetical protein [Runella sp. MFBS21]
MKGKLFFKSHNTGHQGDVFQFVADIKGIDAKADFTALLAAIADDLGVNLSQQKGSPVAMIMSLPRLFGGNRATNARGAKHWRFLFWWKVLANVSTTVQIWKSAHLLE